jgi:hypothetical protein
MSQPIRNAAMEIVVAEELAAGHRPHVLGAAALEKQHGCDILVTAAEGHEPIPVEVKGWGEPFVSGSGLWRYEQDIRASQKEAAERNPEYRIEVVANLTAYLAGDGPYERLTLTAAEISEHAKPRLYDVPLEGKEDEIVRRTAPPVPHPGAR